MEIKSTFKINFQRLLILFFFLVLTCSGREISASNSDELIIKGIETFQKAYNDWDEDEFRSSLTLFKEASLAGDKNDLADYWAGTVYFFLSQYNLFTNDKPSGKKHGIEMAKKGIEVLTRSIESNPGFSESYALRGVLRGILIKMKPSSVFTQGRKVGKDRKKALALNRDNPRVHYLTGVSFWHAPEILGGRDKALEHLLEAEKLYEKEKQDNKDKNFPRWGRSTCLAFIGDVYLSQKENSKAYAYYKKALDVNPFDPLALRGIKKLEKFR